MICYTRNFEDVIIQRVFSGIDQGFYLDIGAFTPIHDSNTYALYERGWRGVIAEPLQLQALWLPVRPEDIFINVAIGDQPGYIDLNIYESGQISSGSTQNIAHLQQHQILPKTKIKVPCLTLDMVIARYLPDHPIHLLSIDVEGMEENVLRGLNLSIYRPWLLVIEAVLPGTSISSHDKWEPLLLEANYKLAYFDGINRFYLAEEHLDLMRHFELPPNVLDQFVMYNEIELRREVDHLTAELEKLKSLKL